MSRRSRSSAVSTLIHGAASSSASGRASSRRQIAVTVGPFAGVRRKSGCTSRTRSTKSRTAGERAEIGGRRRVDVHIQREGADGVLPLSSHMKRGAAGDQHAERGDRCQEIRDQRRRVRDLLEIVEHQQRRRLVARGTRAAWQIDRRDVRTAERLGDRRRDERRIPNGRQRRRTAHARARPRPRSCARAPAPDVSSRLLLARSSVMRRAAGSASQLPQRLQVRVAAEKGRQWQRQRDVASVRRPPWWARRHARLRGARHGLRRSGREPPTARARSRHGAAVVRRAPARSRHEPTSPQWSRAPLA